MLVRALLASGLLLFASNPTPAQVGSVLRSQRIGASQGGFTGTLGTLDGFGSDLASLGDLNGDGVGDLAVAAPGSDDGGPTRGAIWILFLGPDGTVRSQTKISQTQGGFTGLLSDFGSFGSRLDRVGDLDADGVPELAVFSGRPSRVWILFLKSDGTLKSQTENRLTAPAFVQEHFKGGGLEALGDLDGDGLGDLALGAPRDPDGAGLWTGALWIVRLAANGSFGAVHKISQTQGGFTGALQSTDLFGSSIVQLGDLNGDGNRELGVGAPGGGDRAPAFWILYLDVNERVSNQQAFGPGDYLTAREFAWLGDLDGDGVGEMVVDGSIAFLRSDGSVRKRLRHQLAGFRFEPLGDLDGDGALEIATNSDREVPPHVNVYTLDPSAVRNGLGVNPLILTQAGEPVIGSTWSTTLDCSGHARGLAALWGFSAPTSGVVTNFGELLVTGGMLFYLRSPHASGPTPFQLRVPARIELVDLPVYVQGTGGGAPAIALSNALDVLIGK